MRENIKRMAAFINERDGRVRFDEFMHESLFSKAGHYNNGVDIGINGQWRTWAGSPEFAHAISMMLDQKGLSGRDFLEIGGGTGAFKYSYILADPGANYISMDLSKKLSAMQGDGIVASAADLPLHTDSIDGVVFSNELFDMLPLRVFLIDGSGSGKRVEKELFVEAGRGLLGDKLNLVYDKPVQDEFLDTASSYISELCLGGKQKITLAPKYLDAAKEMSRVLRKGEIIVSDYGLMPGWESVFERTANQTPYTKEYRTLSGLRHIKNHPYKTDITHFVDFEFLKHVFEQEGLYTDVKRLGTVMESVLEHAGIYDSENKVLEAGFCHYNPLLVKDEFLMLRAQR